MTLFLILTLLAMLIVFGVDVRLKRREIDHKNKS